MVAHGGVMEHTEAEADAIAKRALVEAEKVRAALDVASAAKERAAVKSNELTGGSLNLPQRHWR
jgi:hypothetical protein